MSSKPIEVLLVQDQNGETGVVSEMLHRSEAGRFRVKSAQTLSTGVQCLQAETFDAVLLDLTLPDNKGLDTLTKLQAERPTIPIVVLGDADDDELAARAVRLGAQDYLIKTTVDSHSLVRAVRYAIERKSVEEALRESEKKHRALLDAIPDMIFRVSADGRFLEFIPSKDIAPIVPASEFLGKKIQDVLPREVAEQSIHFMERALQSGETQLFEYQLVVNGATHYFEARQVRYRHGEVLGIVRDVTESRKAAEALRASEARFRTMFQDAAVGMALVDMDGRPHESNPSLERMLGYGQQELRQMVFTEFTHPEDAQRDMDLFKELVQGKRDHYEMEKRYLRKDGRVVWGHLNVSLVRAAGGIPHYVIAMVEDITERKSTEDALRASEEQLRQAQRMEAVGRLAGGVAHDFNNLLTAILGYTDFALDAMDEVSPLRADLLNVKKNGQRAAVLVRQLLAFSRRQVLQPEVLDLNHTVGNITKMLRRLIGEHIELVTVPDPKLGNVQADPGQIEQVIMNLGVNSRDAMPSGGKLTIKTENVDVGEGYSCMGVLVRPGPYVLLTVSDTGDGMDKDTQARVFEPFFTTKEKGKGTGLGLSTVYGIVKQSGGYIGVDSERGIGTTFKVYLPRVDEEVMARPRTGGHRRPIESSTRETILLVEDEESVRTMARRILEKCGYRVLEARHGVEGLNVSEQHSGAIDLVITDLVMPELSGPQMIERIVSIRPDTKVLYLSGYTEEAVLEHLDRDTPLVQKPFSAKELGERVREVLNPELEDQP
jgi:PAS domain S-box-containing protein